MRLIQHIKTHHRFSIKLFACAAFLGCNSICVAQDTAYKLPPVPTIETIQQGFIENPNNFPEEKMDFPIASGIYKPTWESIDKNYPGEPAWRRNGSLVFLFTGGHRLQEKAAIGMPVILIRKEPLLTKTTRKILAPQ